MSKQVSRDEYTLDCLTCALSTDNHFSKEPIILSGCSHSVCKSCLIKENKTETKCGRCGVVTKRDLKDDKESMQVQALLNNSLSYLHKVIEERMSGLLKKIKTAVEEKDEKVGILVNYIEEEVEIRVESLKIQLDDTCMKIKSDLKAIKQNLIESESKTDEFEQKLNELRADIEKQNTENEEMFYGYQEYYVNLNEKLNRLENNMYQLSIKPSVVLVDEKSLIGQINYVNKLKDAEPVDHFQSKVLSFVDYSRQSATFRYTLTGLSKFKENRFSPPCMIRDLKWFIWLQNIEKEDKKTLDFYVQCKSDKHLKKNATIRAKVEYRLLHLIDKEKNLLKKDSSHDFSINGYSRGYQKFIKFEDLMKPEKGFYNTIDDSITVEVLINTEDDPIEED